MKNSAIALGITGASGAIYGLRLLEQLVIAEKTVYLLISEPARLVIEMETGLQLPSHPQQIQEVLEQRYSVTSRQLKVFGHQQWDAPLASGSNAPSAMVICPCSMATLSAIACGLSRSLLERAADVILKEQHKLIVVPRETPFSIIHLENMLRLARLGTTILPASPGFYQPPHTVESLVDFIVARILDHLEIPHTLLVRWGNDVL